MRGAAIKWGWHDRTEDFDGRDYPLPEGGIAAVKVELIAHAAEILEPGTKFELRRMIPCNYGLGHGMAWVEGWLTPGVTESTPPANLSGAGYQFEGRFTTPETPRV